MKNFKRDAVGSFLCAAGAMAYIALVAFVMMNGERWLGPAKGIAGPVAILTLFVFSALVTGSLILGRPIWIYLEGEKKRAVQFLALNAGWLLVVLVILFLTLASWR